MRLTNLRWWEKFSLIMVCSGLQSCLRSTNWRATRYHILNYRWFKSASLSLSALLLLSCTFDLSITVLQKYLIPLNHIQISPSLLHLLLRSTLLLICLYLLTLLQVWHIFIRNHIIHVSVWGLCGLLMIDRWLMMFLIRHLKFRCGQLIKVVIIESSVEVHVSIVV